MGQATRWGDLTIMQGYPPLMEILTTIGEVAAFFMLGIVACACVMKGLNWLLEKCDPD